MKITFHGAAQTVTGSQHLIEVNGKKIMLDCGLFQGKRKEVFERNRTEFCQGENVDYLVLSLAHTDHSGRSPCLVKNGFTGDIFCTSATRDLCAIMLMDSAFIQEKDVEFVNRRRKKNGQRPFVPLYTKADVAKGMEQNRMEQLIRHRTTRQRSATFQLGSEPSRKNWCALTGKNSIKTTVFFEHAYF